MTNTIIATWNISASNKHSYANTVNPRFSFSNNNRRDAFKYTRQSITESIGLFLKSQPYSFDNINDVTVLLIILKNGVIKKHYNIKLKEVREN